MVQVSPWLFPVVAESRLAKVFFVRDISHIPDLTIYQYEKNSIKANETLMAKKVQ